MSHVPLDAHFFAFRNEVLMEANNIYICIYT